MNFSVRSRLETMKFKKILLGLILADFVFLFFHLLTFTRYSLGEMFNIEADGGLSEWYQYGKEGLACAFLIYVFYRQKSKIYAIWGWLLFYLLIDDSLRLHEQIGEILTPVIPQTLSTLLHVSPSSLGELLFFGLVGIGFIVPGIFFYLHSSQEDKRASLNLFIILGVLGFFGGFVDILHMVASGFSMNPVVIKSLGVFEDGGELLAMSVMLWYAFVLRRRTLAT